jgi:hypothetical protein
MLKVYPPLVLPLSLLSDFPTTIIVLKFPIDPSFNQLLHCGMYCLKNFVSTTLIPSLHHLTALFNFILLQLIFTKQLETHYFAPPPGLIRSFWTWLWSYHSSSHYVYHSSSYYHSLLFISRTTIFSVAKAQTPLVRFVVDLLRICCTASCRTNRKLWICCGRAVQLVGHTAQIPHVRLFVDLLWICCSICSSGVWAWISWHVYGRLRSVDAHLRDVWK